MFQGRCDLAAAQLFMNMHVGFRGCSTECTGIWQTMRALYVSAWEQKAKKNNKRKIKMMRVSMSDLLQQISLYYQGDLTPPPSPRGQRWETAVRNTAGGTGNLSPSSCGNTSDFIADSGVVLSCLTQGVKRPLWVSGWVVLVRRSPCISASPPPREKRAFLHRIPASDN